MLPQTEAVTVSAMPSKTWRLDFKNGRISGMITDPLEAAKQSAICSILTRRFEHVIFSDAYGSELHKLIGSDKALVRAEGERYIREAVCVDQRITGVENVVFDDANGNISFSLVTDAGEVETRSSI